MGVREGVDPPPEACVDGLKGGEMGEVMVYEVAIGLMELKERGDKVVDRREGGREGGVGFVLMD